MGKHLPLAEIDASPVAAAIEILRTCSLEEVAAVLCGLAEGGDERFRKASRYLLAGAFGRRPCDDDASLDQVHWLLKNGQARSIEQAAAMVALTLIGEHSFDAARDRLARKYRFRQKVKSEDRADEIH
jgi:hypothetical protein